MNYGFRETQSKKNTLQEEASIERKTYDRRTLKADLSGRKVDVKRNLFFTVFYEYVQKLATKKLQSKRDG